MSPRAIAYALLSAALFGVSTPLAKLLVGGIAPLALAGLLYLASGVGLGVWLVIRRSPMVGVPRADWPWLAGAIAAGGIVGPALLMYGLRRTEASTASLLLNLEAVFTAALSPAGLVTSGPRHDGRARTNKRARRRSMFTAP